MNRTRPDTVAVIDCGSSAIRTTIAEIRGRGERRIIDTLARDIDLRHVFRLGSLRRGAMEQIMTALEDLNQVLQGYGVERVRAVATSAWRDARNVDGLVEQIHERTGLAIDVIDGGELARLYYQALNGILAVTDRRLPGTTVLADIGSGATVVAGIRGGKLVQSVEERFGTVRLLSEFGELRDSRDFHLSLGRYAHGAAAMMVKRLGRRRVDHLVITGTEIRHLVELRGGRNGGLVTELSAAGIGAWLEGHRHATLGAIAEQCDTDEDGAAALLLGAHLFRELCQVCKHEQALVPQLSLRDGMLADMMPGASGPHHLPRGVLLAAARQLADRYGSNPAYVENTRSLAAQIFDQTTELHHLGGRERILLELAALLHDVGSYVNARSRHKHSYYLIQATDFAGLSELDKTLVAHIARYHRRSTPVLSHLEFQSLPRHERVVVSNLAAILRLAYALDVERTQRIAEVHCTVVGERMLMRTDRRQIALEQWSMSRRSGMFSEVFGLEVVLLGREA